MKSTKPERAIPVVREELTVDKRERDTGKGIRVSKTVSEREHVVDEALSRTDVEVERVTVNQVVDAANIPGIRHEGETLVVPVLEEVLFVEKRTIVKEELRITSKRREVRDPQRVVLRSEELSVESFDEQVDQQSNLP